MKAKEYAVRFAQLVAERQGKDDPQARASVVIANEMLGEMRQTHLDRKAKTDAAVIAILREYRQKWRVFLREAGIEGIIRADALDYILSSAKDYHILAEAEFRYQLCERIAASSVRRD